MYAQIGTHPDLSHAILTLSKYASNPGIAHWQALMHVLWYIEATLHYKITYSGDGFKDLGPVGWADADYGGDIDMRKLCTCYVFIQAGGPTAWSTQYQPTVALLMMEAKYIAVSQATKQILWMFSEMEEVGYAQEKLGVLYNNNSGTVTLTKNTKHNSRIKHIDIRHYFIHGCVENREISVIHVSSVDNLADLFTKALGHISHQHACVLLCLCEPTRLEQGGVL